MTDVVSALKAAGVAEVDDSARRRAEYSSDASLYRVLPQAVVFPRDGDEVAAVLDTCRRLGVPLTARGAGTSIAGNAVGSGVVLDFSRHLGRIRSINPEERIAVVEPGVVLDDVQRAAAPFGLRVGPDPSTHSRCTIGGMIGNNACGSRALAYGRTSDSVVELDVLTGGGERLTARRGTDPAYSPTLATLHRITRQNLAVIRLELGRFSRQVSGYALEHLLPEKGFDVAKMLTGTEGSCALLLGATIRLFTAPKTTVLLVLGYPDMATSADAAPTLLRYHPTAVEGIDARIVDVVRRRRGAAAVPPLPEGAGWLFVELAGDSVAELESTARTVIAASGAQDSMLVTDAAAAAVLWRIREDGVGLSGRSPRGEPAYSGWEDAAVPPERLGAYLRDFEGLLTQYDLTTMPYGHFGDGCVHARIDFPFGRSDGPRVFREFLVDAVHLVATYGGSASGEHGDGRARGELLPLVYSPEALAAFAAVKDTFDPDGVLNPGIVVRPQPVDADLRPAQQKPLRHDLALAYTADHGDFSAAVHRCTGVGRCRADNTASGGVMCPSYVATRDEKDSTRGRARVLQEMVSGSLSARGWRSPAVREVLDLCLSCKGCASDCPTGIDMASYKAEVLYQAYRRRPRPVSHYSLGWLPRWARLAAKAPRLTNRLLSAAPVAAVVKWAGGMDRRRPLPAFAQQNFRRWFAERPARADGDPVLLWVDTFTERFRPEVGIAAVTVLEAAGHRVQLSPPGLCCGLTWISTGQLDAARRILGRSVQALAASGLPIVGLEPSCTAVFRTDARELLGEHSSAADVAAATKTLAEILADWQPPSLSGVRAVAQPHCHQNSVLGWDADRALLRRAGAEVTALGGCCGLAGNFGVERGHYDVSVAVAETALLPAVRAAGADDVVLTDGFSCHTQLDHLTGRRGTHLAELLAEHLPTAR